MLLLDVCSSEGNSVSPREGLRTSCAKGLVSPLIFSKLPLVLFSFG